MIIVDQHPQTAQGDHEAVVLNILVSRELLRDLLCAALSEDEDEDDITTNVVLQITVGAVANFPPLEQLDGLSDLAECGACGRNKPVCCDEGYSDDPETGAVTHVGAVCVDCCRPRHKGGALWHGKSVAGGTYERTGDA